MAVVVGIPAADHDEAVAAVVTPTPGSHVDVQKVIGVAREQLSSYKVPRTVLVLAYDEVPLRDTGKPDRRALQRIVVAREAAEVD